MTEIFEKIDTSNINLLNIENGIKDGVPPADLVKELAEYINYFQGRLDQIIEDAPEVINKENNPFPKIFEEIDNFNLKLFEIEDNIIVGYSSGNLTKEQYDDNMLYVCLCRSELNYSKEKPLNWRNQGIEERGREVTKEWFEKTINERCHLRNIAPEGLKNAIDTDYERRSVEEECFITNSQPFSYNHVTGRNK